MTTVEFIAQEIKSEFGDLYGDLWLSQNLPEVNLMKRICEKYGKIKSKETRYAAIEIVNEEFFKLSQDPSADPYDMQSKITSQIMNIS